MSEDKKWSIDQGQRRAEKCSNVQGKERTINMKAAVTQQDEKKVLLMKSWGKKRNRLGNKKLSIPLLFFNIYKLG